MRLAIMTILFLVAYACGHTDHQDLILSYDEEKVIDVLVDMHIAEAAIGRQNMIFRDSLRKHYRDNILLIHDISESEFDTVFWHIQKDASQYRLIQEEVYYRLKNLKDSSK